MNILAFASRKGGSGKSTLAAHIAAYAYATNRSCLLVDDDPQGSLTLWNDLRRKTALPLKTVKRRTADVLEKAQRHGIEWVLIDTPANASACVVEAMEAATLVIIPCRPGLFDIEAVQETIELARHVRTPYIVVLNGAAPKRHEIESPAVTSVRHCLARLEAPVWGGQITHRASFSFSIGRGASEYDSDSGSVTEISRLWQAIEKSVAVINGASKKTPCAVSRHKILAGTAPLWERAINSSRAASALC